MEEAKRQRIASVLKWVIGIGAVGLAAPFIFIALQGALGLLALGVAAAAGITMIRLAPWFSQVVTNLGIKLFIREIQKNPIESMTSLLVEKTKEAEEADVKIVEFDTEVRNYNDKVKVFSKQYPDEAESFQDISRQMVDGLETMRQEQENARAALADLRQRISKADAIYKMSLAAENVAKLSRSAEQKVFQDIKERVAFDSVQSSLNRSFAALNMAVSKRKALQATNVVPITRVTQDAAPAAKTIGRMKQ